MAFQKTECPLQVVHFFKKVGNLFPLSDVIFVGYHGEKNQHGFKNPIKPLATSFTLHLYCLSPHQPLEAYTP
jgi:hypothetical protein